MTTPNPNSFLLSSISVLEANLELDGLFWFHSVARPRSYYVHSSLPVIHNYPLILALLGRSVESSYIAIPGEKTKRVNPREIWEEYGIYVYPAVAERIMTRTILFSMGGTGYVTMKTKTRASVPDLTANQVYLPGTIFKTYILLHPDKTPEIPEIIRLGAKRYGTFRVQITRKYRGKLSDPRWTSPVTHPFNADECPANTHLLIMTHYAGNIAQTGTPKRAILARNIVLAAPHFLVGDT